MQVQLSLQTIQGDKCVTIFNSNKIKSEIICTYYEILEGRSKLHYILTVIWHEKKREKNKSLVLKSVHK